MKHELWELQSMQAAPLAVKISLTRDRIKQWVEHYGEDGVYISFSGGKDSTVLLQLVREMYPGIPAVFVDVPTQYPELREFAKTFDNVNILPPPMSFMQLCNKYGFPFISKEVSDRVYFAQKYLKWLGGTQETKRPTDFSLRGFLGIGEASLENVTLDALTMALQEKDRDKARHLLGDGFAADDSRMYEDAMKYKFMALAPFTISRKCCDVLKKIPLHNYERDTKRVPMTAQMASESRIRTQRWMLNGCNGFDLKRPISHPMAFWTEQDVLQYIWETKIEICSVYGEVVPESEVGQISLSDLGLFDKGLPTFTTTGCSRTGCMLCGFGCHLDKGKSRFELLHETHPKMYAMLDVVKNNGITMREAIDWMNEHGNLHIRY